MRHHSLDNRRSAVREERGKGVEKRKNLVARPNLLEKTILDHLV